MAISMMAKEILPNTTCANVKATRHHILILILVIRKQKQDTGETMIEKPIGPPLSQATEVATLTHPSSGSKSSTKPEVLVVIVNSPAVDPFLVFLAVVWQWRFDHQVGILALVC